jgi:hypothetical protein
MQYPATTLSFQKGKYYVVVTIPVELREHFNSRKQMKLSTGKPDRQLAQQMQHDKSVKLYSKLDQAIKTKSPIYIAMKSYIDEIGFNGEDYLEGKALSNPDEIEDILFQFRDEMLRKMHGGDPNVKADAQAMHIAQLEIEPVYDKISKLCDDRKVEIEQRFEKKFSDAADEYVANKKWGRDKTKLTAEKAISEFIEHMGDMPLSKITKKTGYDYAKILDKTLANKTIKNRIGFATQVLVYSEKEGWIDNNPLHGLSLGEYGKPTEKYRCFTTDQLEELFKLELPDDVDLLLSILITTGMRLDEVATLEFSDIKTEKDISYIDLTSDGKVIKNIVSKRKIPLIPHLKKEDRYWSGKVIS